MAKKSKKSDKPKEKGKRSWKLLGTTAALTAGIATAKALDAAWKTATGKRPPDAPESPEIGNREALVWAAVSGMAMGVAKMYATRRAASYWVKSFGTLPPGMNKGASKETKKKVKT
ncbi:MAG: DUF4235 domain-containing protein [Nocardioidaceae bacterium]